MVVLLGETWKRRPVPFVELIAVGPQRDLTGYSAYMYTFDFRSTWFSFVIT